MLIESMNRGYACQVTVAARTPRRTNVARVQGGCMPSEPPQASCARFAANLHTRRVFAIHTGRRHLHATWPSATTARQALAIWSLSERRRGILAASGTRALPRPDRHTPWAKARPKGAQRGVTQRHRPAVYGVLEAGRHDGAGGQAHVLAVTGSAYSQAPPMAHADGAARRDHGARTALRQGTRRGLRRPCRDPWPSEAAASAHSPFPSEVPRTRAAEGGPGVTRGWFRRGGTGDGEWEGVPEAA